MDAPVDFARSSRAELAAIIVAQRQRIADVAREVAALGAQVATQQALIAQLTEQVGTLLAQLADGDDGEAAAPGPRRMPGLKPGGRLERSCRPRRRRLCGYGRRRMRPTARQVHAYAQCPHCHTGLRAGTIKRTREVIEVVPAPVVVTEHVYLERRCARCGGRWLPAPELAGVVVGQGRLGVGLLSLIAALREELRLPIGAIQWYLHAVHGLHLSVGAIVRALHTVAAHAAPVVAQLWEAIRASPVLHADETGWREDGVNGYIWTFSTATERVFVRGSRERTILEAAVGDAYAGVLVSDFYAAYTTYAGRHQYCWAHLLRDVDELVAQHRDHAGVRGWADAIHALYQRAIAVAASPEQAVRRQGRQQCEAELKALCAPFCGNPDAPQRVLGARILTHLHALLVFVEDPAVPPTNNAAERSLRHLVTSRKISGGTRSPVGTATKMTLATLFGTWRLHELDPLAACRALLANPQL